MGTLRFGLFSLQSDRCVVGDGCSPSSEWRSLMGPALRWGLNHHCPGDTAVNRPPTANALCAAPASGAEIR